MNRKIWIYLSVFIFLTTACKSLSRKEKITETTQNSLLWKVEGKTLKKPYYIYGTLHLFCKNDWKIYDPVKAALDSSEYLVLEMKDAGSPENLTKIYSLAIMGDGKTLSNLLSEKEFDEIGSWYKNNLGIDLYTFQAFHPMIISSLLITKYFDCNPESGVDMELEEYAKEHDIKLLGLETAEEQIKFLMELDPVKSAKSLYHNIHEFDKSKKYFAELYQNYIDQKLIREELINDKNDPSAEEFTEHLLIKRNNNWIQKINGFSKESSHFIAVGAAHLSGKNGLINLLRKNGYKLTAIPIK